MTDDEPRRAARSKPPPSSRQGEMDALIAAALRRSPLDPRSTQRSNVIRLLTAMTAVAGSSWWPRGWVRSVVSAFEDAGALPPTTHSLRWYRTNLVSDPLQFERVDGADEQGMAILLGSDR